MNKLVVQACLLSLLFHVAHAGLPNPDVGGTEPESGENYDQDFQDERNWQLENEFSRQLMLTTWILFLRKRSHICCLILIADCNISDKEACNSPWLGYLRINNHTEENQPHRDAYWPVVIIGPSTVLTGVRAFRSPYSVRKLNILDLDMYHVHLKGNMTRDVSFIHINPNVSVCAEHWMTMDNEFALVYLDEPIIFSEEVRPLCLPTWDQSLWEEKAANNESLVEDEELTLVSGWICNYHNALRQHDAFFGLRVKSDEKCREIWKGQADYSESDGTVYGDRICGYPTRNTTENGTILCEWPTNPGIKEDDGGILCVEKFYFSIQTQNENERVLTGIFNGIAQEVYKGPTAYVLLLKPLILEWINASIECGPHRFACDNGDECIHMRQVCDDEVDCKDASDENLLFCRARAADFDDIPNCDIPNSLEGPDWLVIGLTISGMVIVIGALYSGSNWLQVKAQFCPEACCVFMLLMFNFSRSPRINSS